MPRHYSKFQRAQTEISQHDISGILLRRAGVYRWRDGNFLASVRC
jgi:hypothetical protein